MQLAVACAAGLAISINDLQEWQVPVLEVEVVTMTNSFAVEASTWIIIISASSTVSSPAKMVQSLKGALGVQKTSFFLHLKYQIFCYCNDLLEHS